MKSLNILLKRFDKNFLKNFQILVALRYMMDNSERIHVKYNDKN